ncbi:hypothetical protein K3495_g7365 [Podosphaera aphanis]|nr:hypothetical protein K3495_g7365 [Podosphaera aphanis]
MNSLNASNTMDFDPVEDASSRNTRNTAESGGRRAGAGKAPLNVDNMRELEKFQVRYYG